MHAVACQEDKYEKTLYFCASYRYNADMRALLFLRKDPLGAAFIIYLFAVGLTGLPCEQVGRLFTDDPRIATIAGMAVCRAVSAVVMLFFCIQLGLFDAPRPAVRSLRAALPALLVALNNAPVIALISGTAAVTAQASAVVLFAFECVAVAAFEEVAFRAILFPLMLQRFGTGARARFSAVLLSSALFGFTHLLNLFSGAAVGATALQVGYSFLIGCMLAVVYLHTGSLAGCILLHAVYNFGGMLVPTLGQGAFADIWNLPTVLITAVLAVFAIVFYLRLLLREDALRAGSLCRLTAEQRFALRRIHV